MGSLCGPGSRHGPASPKLIPAYACRSANRAQAISPLIPLSLLNRKIAKEVEVSFGYVAGGDPDIPLLLATFRKDEDLPS